MASERVGRAVIAAQATMPDPVVYAGRVALVILGLFVFALGVALNLRSGLGLGPWDVLHQGISRHTPLTFGQASQLAGAVVIGVGLLLRVRPGLSTILNMLLIGFFVDRILGSRLVPSITPYGPVVQLVVDALGVLLVGLGSGLYIRGNLGAGPRDGLMLGLQRVTGQRIAVTRAALEIAVAALGFLLGGTLGLGTLIFALGVGPAVELGFRLCGVPRHSRHEESAADLDLKGPW